MKPSLFAIFLHENPDGTVVISADFIGLGQNAFDLGIEIMANMREMEKEYPQHLTVRPLTMSEYYN